MLFLFIVSSVRGGGGILWFSHRYTIAASIDASPSRDNSKNCIPVALIFGVQIKLVSIAGMQDGPGFKSNMAASGHFVQKICPSNTQCTFSR